MKTNNKIIIFILGILLLSVSCSEEHFEVKTTDQLTADDAAKAMESDPAKLTGFVDAIYNILVQYDLVSDNHDAFGFMSILHSTDLMSEDIVMAKLHWFLYDYQHDNREWNYRRTNVNWTYLYTVISGANNVLGMTDPETTSAEVLKYRGQAFALRGMAYFYLIQLYQHVYPALNNGEDLPGIPLYYASNEEEEDVLGRAPVAQVLAQIEKDLKAAANNLRNAAPRASKNNIDYSVANGLLARYYLLAQKWPQADSAATEALKNYSVQPASRLTDGFMDINNSEWMWGYDHNAETTGLYASFFSHISNLTSGYAGADYAPRLIDKRLYESIPSTDARKNLFQNPEGSIVVTENVSADAIAWQRPYATLKFGYDGNFTMDYCYMRASEMVLIQAEALAHQSKGTEAANALRVLMNQRDPAWNASTVTVNDVWMQRRIELWGEGFSYFDLKRLNKGINRNYQDSNHEPSALVEVPAGDKRWIYQIPQNEIRENPEIAETDNNE
ncbi:MAG: RagB/SusD family nutrient uptake outer membrane protein [Prolixibacteraceae bacterium]|nr:RagB/SusD family nutrient uptake outer membrane protein [Prolixibacteraceae bacterium]